jgi:hypothetical protein
MQIMKKLFFSLVLGTIIAICWVMIIHTLKWIAIRGNEFELWQLQQQQLQQLHTPGGNYNNQDNIQQANLLLAHQSIQVGQQAPPAPSQQQQQQQQQRQEPQLSQAHDAKGAPSNGSAPAATSTRPPPAQLYPAGAEDERKRRHTRVGAPGRAARAAPSGREEIKALKRQPQTIDDGPDGHELAGQQAKRDNDAPSLARVSSSPSFMSITTGQPLPPSSAATRQGGRSRRTAGSRPWPRPAAAAAGDDERAHSADVARQNRNGASVAIADELPRPRRLMQLSSISREQRPAAGAGHPADQRRRATAPIQATGGGLSVLADMGDENDEPDTLASSNDLTTIMSTPALEPHQAMNDGANEQSATAVATIAVLPSGSGAEADQSGLPPPPLPAPNLDGGAIERSSASLDGQVAAGQVLVYRAPFFTSWFVSIWNIAFMPVFTIISSCCFRNEESTTKKLLA